MSSNILDQIADRTVTSKTILTYTGTKVTGYTLAPCFFHATAAFMGVCVIFFDGTEATVSYDELEVKA